jgi:hypothetical protein
VAVSRSFAHSPENEDKDNDDLFEAPQASMDNNIVAAKELDPGLISDTDEALLVGEMVEMRQELEETSGVKAIAYDLLWETIVRSPLRTNLVVL